jgi:nucleotide-binding universal stress UspA family protein
MIRLGSRGLNAVRRLLVGSVSAKFANHARCGVLMFYLRQFGYPVPTLEEKETVTV